jgi:hypothetical protein
VPKLASGIGSAFFGDDGARSGALAVGAPRDQHVRTGS